MSKMRIKEVALKLFALRGYEATTMRDMAKEVGIKAPSIYSHYENKETIFLELIDDLICNMKWENLNVTEISNDTNFNIKTVLFDVFLGYYQYFSNNKYQLLFWQRIRFFQPLGLEGKYSTNKLSYDRPVLLIYIELFRQGMIKGQVRKNNIEILVMSYFAFVSGYVDSLLIIPVAISDNELSLAFELFWRGIKAD